MKLIVASLAVLAAQVAAIFNQEGVAHCNSQNWADTVEADDDNVWIVTFYADWCPYCKTWDEELSAALQDPALADKKVRFGAVDVMANRDLTTRFGIKRSPTVKIFGLDKFAPFDYVGHRKHADFVNYVGDYSTEHGYIIVPVVSYEYNVDAIVQTIATAHEERVNLANSANSLRLSEIEQQYYTDVETVKSDFDEQLQALIAARAEALSSTGTVAQDTYTATKSEHEQRIVSLDEEAIQTIESIIAAHRDEQDLTDFIASLEKEWFMIEWNNTNRREIVTEEVVPVPHTHNQPAPTPQTPVYNGGYQNNYYNAPAQENYYNQQQQQYQQQYPQQKQYAGQQQYAQMDYGYEQQYPQTGYEQQYAQQQNYGYEQGYPQQQYNGSW